MVWICDLIRGWLLGEPLWWAESKTDSGGVFDVLLVWLLGGRAFLLELGGVGIGVGAGVRITVHHTSCIVNRLTGGGFFGSHLSRRLETSRLAGGTG